MEKKKRIISKLIFVLVLAAVVSMCFVGTTLARYVSSDSGSATTGVALWKLDFAQSGGTSASFGQLSPEAKALGEGSGASNVRVKSTDVELISTITYDIDVDADLTVTIDKNKGEEGDTYRMFDFTMVDQAESFGNTDWIGGTVSDSPTRDDVSSLFTVALSYDSDGDAADTTSVTDGGKIDIAAGEGKIYIYATLTWTSADTALSTNADVLDTWVGRNVASVDFDLTYSAVQASEQPTA